MVFDLMIIDVFELEFFSVEQLNDSMKNIHLVNIDVMQTSKGHYYSLYHGFTLPKISISRRVNKSDLLIKSKPEKNEIIIIIPDEKAEILCNGVRITYDELFIYAENDELHLKTFKNHLSYMITIDESELALYVGFDILNIIKNKRMIFVFS